MLMNEGKNLKIIIYGAGAIGTSLAGFLTPHYDQIYLLARGENAKVLKSQGLILYEKENDNPEPISVNIIENLSEIPNPDVVMISVKNYSLEEVAKDISSKLDDEPIIVGLQNGIKNQEILPKYFSKIIYGVILYTAWRDEPGVFGFTTKGPLVLGTKDNDLQEEIQSISDILDLGIKANLTNNLQDAARCKMIMNLSNAAATLIKLNFPDEDSFTKFRKIIINLFLEGIEIIKAAGFSEQKLDGMPSWKLLKLANKIPKKMANKTFRKSMTGMLHNSMAQDKILRERDQSELESLSGYFIELANSLNLEIPYNETIYQLSKEEFQKKPFNPLPIDTVWKKIQSKIL
ncbi:MAG: 2-dehydropantoate 2-reductase [Candidatus Lokiarchaeota archaeon]|nr:2-dehydropantoate 2-reductase [Candidatus Lokiarchaeota archaeon]MBD3337834.1 2-dehydropantoate 2-reductase [Candidatus Lokiarchaeota archaeon]